MPFDINAVLTEMKNAAIDAVKNDVSKIPDYMMVIFENQKDAIMGLVNAKISGEINDAIFENELKRLQKVFETELLTVKIITNAMAQKAANAALKILSDAVYHLINPI